MLLRWLSLAAFLLAVAPAQADQPTWGAFLEGVYEQGRSEGISEATLLEALNGSAHLEPNLASLCARLDFNEFYSFGPGGKYT